MDTTAAAAPTTFIFRHTHSWWRHTELRVTLFDGPDAGTGAPFLVHLITHTDDYDYAYYYHHEWTVWCQARAATLRILFVHHNHEDTDRHRRWIGVNAADPHTLEPFLRQFFNMPVVNAFDADLERMAAVVYAASAPEHYTVDAAAAVHDIFPLRYEPVPHEPGLYYAFDADTSGPSHIVAGSFDRLLDRAAFFDQERAYYEADIVHAGDVVSAADGLHTTLYIRAAAAPPPADSWQAVIYEFFCRGVWHATGLRETTTWAMAATTIQRAFRFRYYRRRMAAASVALTRFLPRVLRREVLIATGIMAAAAAT